MLSNMSLESIIIVQSNKTVCVDVIYLIYTVKRKSRYVQVLKKPSSYIIFIYSLQNIYNHF